MSSQPQRDTNAASAPSSTRSQAHTRFWPSAASRRAERIRNLDPSHDRAYSQFTRALGHAWDSSISAATAAAAAANPTDNDFSRSFEHVNSHLRALIDITSQSPATTFAPAHNHHPYTSAGHRQQPDFGSAGSRSHKRRKIDETQQSIPRPPPLRYGRYGQVEQGKLWMDMIRCDGGMFSNESSYAATNILRDDSSVYCTKGNRCNIVLQHHGATAFTLEELVIRGPTSINYSHPYDCSYSLEK